MTPSWEATAKTRRAAACFASLTYTCVLSKLHSSRRKLRHLLLKLKKTSPLQRQVHQWFPSKLPPQMLALPVELFSIASLMLCLEQHWMSESAMEPQTHHYSLIFQISHRVRLRTASYHRHSWTAFASSTSQNSHRKSRIWMNTKANSKITGLTLSSGWMDIGTTNKPIQNYNFSQMPSQIGKARWRSGRLELPQINLSRFGYLSRDAIPQKT